ncbi:MAG TPA: hypothetical protein VIM70_09420 [Clostridium sp.]|uniref:hypothetical protein n=1 Tax=Clostridium sp. TaxID=1506 RepID=UPI002F92B560
MKKNINKKVIGILAIIIIVIAIASVFYINNKPNKAQASAPITATVRKAAFSSVVNVTLSVEGKKQYKGAVKYQIFYEGKAVSPKTVIGKPTTAYPARKEKDKVAVKLLKADDKVAYSVDLSLQKGEAVKKN